MPMKRPLLALAILTSLCGCISTNYYTNSGSGGVTPLTGQV